MDEKTAGSDKTTGWWKTLSPAEQLSYMTIARDFSVKKYAELSEKYADLLKALEDLAKNMKSFREDGMRPDEWLLKEWEHNARAAIKKATG